ncbi:MAG: hypothetical protein KJ658_07525 [Proteobacteria bacterium]|nr:hypothetical protein [Desulfobacula sp.]MBU3951974.1 hypothetical protein [Pseudomonadota bacterium]
MGYAYVSYCVVLSILTLVVCFRSGRSKWWAAIVLILPPALPIFVLKSKKGRGVVWLTAFFITFFAVAGTEFFLYTAHKEKNKYSYLPPIVREMISLNEQVKAATIEVYNASGKLASLSLVQSRITDIRTTLDLIKEIRLLVEKNQTAIDRLVHYTQDHADYILRQKLDWAFLIRQFYSDPTLAQHHDSQMRYLAAFEDMLRYTHDNFNNIMVLKSSAHMANYDAYYLRYRSVADAHNRVNKKRVEFQNQFIQAHPKVKPFVPGAHHIEPFKFWDKFAF